MHERDEKFIQYWSRLRARGKKRYLLMALVWVTFPYVIIKELTDSTLFNRGDYVFDFYKVVISTVVAVGITLLFARWQWKASEKKYKDLTSEK